MFQSKSCLSSHYQHDCIISQARYNWWTKGLLKYMCLLISVYGHILTLKLGQIIF